MTTKAKNKVAKKAPRKLTLNKETLRDLSPGGKAKAVRGGAGRQSSPNGCMGSDWCFGTLA